MAGRPLLVVRQSCLPEGPVLGIGRSAAHLLRAQARSRVVLKVDEIASCGLALVALLWRAGRCNRSGPTLIGVEIDPRVPVHRAVLASLLVLTDVVPGSRAAVQAASRGAADGPKAWPLRWAGSLWLAGLYETALLRMVSLLKRRPTRRILALAVLQRLANYWPRTTRESSLMARVARSIAETLSCLPQHLQEVFVAIVRARATAAVPHASIVRASHTAARPSERVVIRALYASCVAQHTTRRAGLSVAHQLRAAELGTSLARRAGLRALERTSNSFSRVCRGGADMYAAGDWRARRNALARNNDGAWVCASTACQAFGLMGSIPFWQVRALVSVYISRPGQGSVRWGYDAAEMRAVFRPHCPPERCMHTGFRGRCENAIANAIENRFIRAPWIGRNWPRRDRAYLQRLSLGLLDSSWGSVPWADSGAGRPGFLAHMYATHQGASPLEVNTLEPAWCREGAVDMACLSVMQGATLREPEERLLKAAARAEVSWSRRLVVCICLAKVRMRVADVVGAARALAQAVEAHRGFVRLQKRQGVAERPALLRDYEDFCARVLAAFEPPVRAGRDPVAAVARLGRLLPAPPRTRPQRAIDALDALVANHARPCQGPCGSRCGAAPPERQAYDSAHNQGKARALRSRPIRRWTGRFGPIVRWARGMPRSTRPHTDGSAPKARWWGG